MIKYVTASKLGKYIGRNSVVYVFDYPRYGRIIHVNVGIYFVYVYVMTSNGTTSCGRYPRWKHVRLFD